MVRKTSVITTSEQYCQTCQLNMLLFLHQNTNIHSEKNTTVIIIQITLYFYIQVVHSNKIQPNNLCIPHVLRE